MRAYTNYIYRALDEVGNLSMPLQDILRTPTSRIRVGHLPLSEVDTKVLQIYLLSSLSWERLSNRYTCWTVDGNCACHYRYGSVSAPPQPMSPVLKKLSELLGVSLGLDPAFFNSANLNVYIEGADSVGWHADNEKLFENPQGFPDRKSVV